MTASIIDFLDDDELLGRHFTGPSWDRWRAVLKAAFALPMDATELELFHEVAGDRDPPQKPVRELVAAVGRSGGKDSVASALACYIACTADTSGLRSGEKASILCLAVDRPQASIAYSYIRGIFEDEETPLIRGMVKQRARRPVIGDAIELTNNTEIIVGTSNRRSPRGRTIACAIFDEVAFWWSDDYANPDVEIDAAVSPGLARFPGSLKILISSVHKRSGLLYDKFAKYYGKDDPDTLVVLGESLQFNPSLDSNIIERELERDYEKARAEYLSIWRDDLSNFLDRVLVERAVTKGITGNPPQSGTHYTGMVDVSGGRSDSFAAAIGHRDGDLLIIDALFERRSPFDSGAVTDEVSYLLRSYRVGTITGDSYGADWVVDAFKRRGITYRNLLVTGADGRKGRLSRSEIYLNSIPYFTGGRVRLPDNARLINQLIALERRAARSSGHDTVDHPRGSHDDLANAACGCLVALAARSAPMILSEEQLATLRAMPRQRFSGMYDGLSGGRNRFARAR